MTDSFINFDWDNADKTDVLRKNREAFYLPEGKIYLDGNSLGPLPLAVKKRMQAVVEDEWGNELIHAWNSRSWIDLSQQVGDKIAPLIGARIGQVIACDSISVNLFKLIAAALNIQAPRNVVLSVTDNFPTDLYVMQGLSSLLGSDKCQYRSVCEDMLMQAIDEEPAVLLLTHVNFRSGKRFDMEAITRTAHERGVLVIWDLAHSAGAMPIGLDDCHADFAVGCGYKYLNGGPGAPAFVYVAERWQSKVKQPLSGWMGHASPFAFNETFTPADGILRMLCGTPNILSLAALDAALSIFSDVDLDALRFKSLRMSRLLMDAVETHPSLKAFDIISPKNDAQRGSQVALAHSHAYEICQALIADGVTGDFRAPDILRFGLTPLYLSYLDLRKAIDILIEIMDSKRYLEPSFSKRQKVT